MTNKKSKGAAVVGFCFVAFFATISQAQDILGIDYFLVRPEILAIHSHPKTDEPNQSKLLAHLKTPKLFTFEVPETLTPCAVALRYVGPVTDLEIRDQGFPAVGDLDGLIEHYTRNAVTERKKAERLFYFVINQMKDWYYPAQGIDLTVEDLRSLIWNYGYGFCYDLGRLQAGLWAEAGLRSRIVGWPQHTLAEVFYDNAWRLYDLQHRNFYLMKDQSVAGFKEIKEDSSLLFQKLNEYGLDPIGYPPHHLAHWYKIATPKFEDSADRNYWKTNKDFRIDLRIGEIFEIFFTEECVVYHPDSWFQYYGEFTLRKDPPWPVKGTLTYAPRFVNQKAVWKETQSPNNARALSCSMSSPFIFTEAWIKVPNYTEFSLIWVKAHSTTHFVGRLVGGVALLNRYIAGCNQFEIIIQPNENDALLKCQKALEASEIHTNLQLSHIGLPTVRPGKNVWPINFAAGTPQINLWLMKSAAELTMSNFQVEPPNPKIGDEIELVYSVKNQGSAESQPTSLTIYNNVTSFASETRSLVGVHTLPPIQPGETFSQKVFWRANTRMTWYGQNPNVQLFDAWLDIKKTTADANRENNRRQDFILLLTRDGKKPEIPGYKELPNAH